MFRFPFFTDCGRAFLLVALLILVLGSHPAGAAQCIEVGEDLRLDFPCVEYSGVRYQLRLEFYEHPDASAGLYWRLDPASLAVVGSDDPDCLAVGEDLMVYVTCAAYDGGRYRFRLDSVPDPAGLLWQMDEATFSAIPDSPPAGTGILDVGDAPFQTRIVYHAPASLATRRNPGLLVYLPGDGESAVDSMAFRLERDFAEVAESEGLLVIGIEPNGRGFQIVDAGGRYQTDDYYNAVDAIRLAHRTWAINPYRTYLTGYSAGGPGAVMLARGELRPWVRAVTIWCAPYNVHALIPNDWDRQVPVRVVSNPGDPNYYSFFQVAGAGGNGSFGYWPYFLSVVGHPVEPITETRISGHRYDARSVRDALNWMLER